MPKICEILLNLEGFQYATSLDLNMGCYNIRLSKQVSKLCKIILPWGKYRYKRLPMGMRNSPDIFQDKMNEIFRVIEFIQAYIDELLIITNVDWSNNLETLELTLKNLQDNGLKCNVEILFWTNRNRIYRFLGHSYKYPTNK